MFKLHQGDCLDVMKTYPSGYFSGIVTDPPYGISFMNHGWDYAIPKIENFQEMYRTTKAGGLIFCFASARTQHRMAFHIEKAGWNLVDYLFWVRPGHMPPRMNLPKAIDATLLLGGSSSSYLREVEQQYGGESYTTYYSNNGVLGDKKHWERKRYTTQTEQGISFEGYGTKLMPTFEPIIVAAKGFPSCVIEGSRNLLFGKPSKKDKGVFNKHPTVKPRKLMEELLARGKFTSNDVVLDPYMGSGTTILAAKTLGIPSVGCEYSQEYIDIAEKRLDPNYVYTSEEVETEEDSVLSFFGGSCEDN